MRSRFRLPFLIASVALLLIAAAAVVFVNDEIALGREGDSNDNVVVDEGQQLLDGDAISVEEAIAAAQDEASGPVDDVEIERRGDQTIYDIEIGSTNVVVDASNGSIVSVKQDDDDDDDDRREETNTPQDFDNLISVDDAIEAARAEASGNVHDIELEDEDGLLVYSIEIGDYEVEVDATTGEVLSSEVDD